MIDPKHRFYQYGGMLFASGPYQWYIMDFELRRCFQVSGPPDLFPDEDAAIEVLGKFVDNLPPDVYSIGVSDDLQLVGIPDKDLIINDPTPFIQYPRVEIADWDRDGEWLSRSDMFEVDRIHVGVDLVRPTAGRDSGKLRIFKYTIIPQRPRNIWDEAHILKGLRGHPSIIELEQFVLDDIEHRLVGFTTSYITGGTLEQYNGQFLFRWLPDLTTAIDDLNLRFGIQHQDVAPRNILVEPSTSTLKLFDFDRAAKLGSPEVERGRSDVDGLVFTIYEALTKDDHFRRVPFYEQEVKLVEQMEHWDLKLEIETVEGGINAYRTFLIRWADDRRENRNIGKHADASVPLDWPVFPMESRGPFYREQAYNEKRHVIWWERGSQITPELDQSEACPMPPTDVEVQEASTGAKNEDQFSGEE